MLTKILVGALAGLALASPPASSTTISVIARSGDAVAGAPDLRYSSFGGVVINAAGDVGFAASLNGSFPDRDNEVIVGPSGLQARAQPPRADGAQDTGFVPISITDAGEVVYRASTRRDRDFLGDVIFGPAGAELRTGDPFANRTGTIDRLSNPAGDADGAVFYTTRGLVNGLSSSLLMRGDAAVLAEGETLPDGRIVRAISKARVANDGTPLFSGAIFDPAEGAVASGLFTIDGRQIFDTTVSIDGVGRPRADTADVSARGDVVAGGAIGRDGAVMGTMGIVARDGAPAPGTDGVFSIFGSADRQAVTDGGHVAFMAAVTDPLTGVLLGSGLFGTGSDGLLGPLLAPGQRLDIGAGLETIEFVNGLFGMNAAGSIAANVTTDRGRRIVRLDRTLEPLPLAPPVAPVPLPAGVWLLLAALGGLRALRRRAA